MIAKLKGLIDSVADTSIVIDVQGVGYLVSCSRKTIAQLPEPGQAATLYIETVLRQDMLQLFGFADMAEKDWFNLLTTVQGVGMKVGLAILSALSPNELGQALTNQDKAMFTRADGVGPKLAARITNELKDKRPSSFLAGNIHVLPQRELPAQEEAISALVNLGYRRQEAVEAVRQACHNQDGMPTVEDLIRIGLNKLARA
jgi:Holliday junction DNA helicase RuvA